MSEFRYIRLPIVLHPHAPEVHASESLDDEQFAVQQVAFIKALFGYVAYLRECSRETPIADAFLSTFVNLLETLEANGPGEATGLHHETPADHSRHFSRFDDYGRVRPQCRHSGG